MAKRNTLQSRAANRSASAGSARAKGSAVQAPAEAHAATHCLLTIKAVPNAPRSEVVGWLGDALKVRLKSPPVDGKANAELCRYLAEVLALPKSAVALATGGASREKRLRIDGLSLAQLRARLLGAN